MRRIRIQKPKSKRRRVHQDEVEVEVEEVALLVCRAAAARDELLERIDALLDEVDRAVGEQR